MLIPSAAANGNGNNLVRHGCRTGRGSRGAFVVLEGIDRSGKTSQCKLLLQRLVQAGIAATSMRFPNRTTATGRIINEYLQQSSSPLDDRAIHLLFSANRWEACPSLVNTLLHAGTTVVCDRYAYSGVAFSSAKVSGNNENAQLQEPPPDQQSTKNKSEQQVMSLEWCQAPDRGLPAPDCVIFLQLSPEQAEQRGGYGEERYEKRDIQLRVRERFAELQRLDEQQRKQQEQDATASVNKNGDDDDKMIYTPSWHVVDAAQSLEQVETEIWDIVQSTLSTVHDTSAPLGKLWEAGTFQDDDHGSAAEDHSSLADVESDKDQEGPNE